MILWDNNKDHPASRFDRLGDFVRELAKANQSGRGFRIAYTGEASPGAFEIWSAAVWAVLDGKKITYVQIEEYSDCCFGAGALPRSAVFHRRLWTQGRKYGAIIHATSQRPQLISKDALGNAGVLWASNMDTLAAKRIAAEMDITPDELRGCGVGEFWQRDNGAPAQKIKVFTPI